MRLLRHLVVVGFIFGNVALSGCDESPGGSSGTPVILAPFACGAKVTPISSIQNSKQQSKYIGSVVDVEGLLTFVFEAGKSGYILEASVAERDQAVETSEGLFIDAPFPLTDSKLGMRVRVRGTVTEMSQSLGAQTNPLDPHVEAHTRTALSLVSESIVCAEEQLPDPVIVSSTPESWDRFESMRVKLSAPLTVVGNNQLVEKGVLQVSTEGRLFQATERFPPGPDAEKLFLANQKAQISIEDHMKTAAGRSAWFGATIDSEKNWRVGTIIQGVEGIIDRLGTIRLWVTHEPNKIEHASRPLPPAKVGDDYTVASFNLENWFNGDGMGGQFPTPRGASDFAQMQRQQQKLVAAVAAVRPDVVALIEVENDGYTEQSAIAQFAQELNKSLLDEGDYLVVDPGDATLGDDLIKVGMIYRATRVELTGKAATLTRNAFASGNRPPLAQAFKGKKGGDAWVVVVNHWKSKGGCEQAQGVNKDQGDGQGCWNGMRVDAAREISEWLNKNAVTQGITDQLIVGDLNSYGQEDPIRLLRQQGYVDVVAQWLRDQAYSYVFDARSGRLDHALASPSMAKRVTGIDEWHINADELPIFGYAQEEQLKSVVVNPYRSSDHDPLIVRIRNP